MRIFRDRDDAGRELAKQLVRFQGKEPVVYGLARGGVITGRVVADALGAPLDVVVARKIGHPNNMEYAIGAVTADGDVVLNELEAMNLSQEWLRSAQNEQIVEARRKLELYRGSRPPISVEGRVAILVDDGIATGYTMMAAIKSLRRRTPARVIVAAPVAPRGTLARFCPHADQAIVSEAPIQFYSIGEWFADFPQVTDSDVIAALNKLKAY